MSDERRSDCPVACALDLVGDRWTLLVLRDLFLDKHHFEEFLESEERISTNILAERLQRLQALGMVEVEVCADNRRRKRYELTKLGKSFAPVVTALAKWGLQHIPGTVPSPKVRAALAADMPRRGRETR